mgnify:FL=1
MNADDKSKLKAYEELIGSLEHTNGLQHRVIETQYSLINSLEEHNAELEKIIDDLTNILGKDAAWGWEILLKPLQYFNTG